MASRKHLPFEIIRSLRVKQKGLEKKKSMKKRGNETASYCLITVTTTSKAAVLDQTISDLPHRIDWIGFGWIGLRVSGDVRCFCL